MAIKRLKREWVADAVIRSASSAKRGSWTTSSSTPSIVQVVYRNVSGDEPYFVMRRAECSVADRLGVFAGEEGWVCEVYRQILEAMAYAPGKGVIHRDLKPENALLVEGVVQVTDFGLSKALEGDRGRPH